LEISLEEEAAPAPRRAGVSLRAYFIPVAGDPFRSSASRKSSVFPLRLPHLFPTEAGYAFQVLNDQTIHPVPSGCSAGSSHPSRSGNRLRTPARRLDSTQHMRYLRSRVLDLDSDGAKRQEATRAFFHTSRSEDADLYYW